MQNITLNCPCFFQTRLRNFQPACFHPAGHAAPHSFCILHSAFLHSAFYHASSPFTSGSTSSKALMPTWIMESSGSKVVKF